MHLSRIESLFGDITVSEDSNVLGNFPPNTFQTILTDVTQMLLTTGQSHQILTTEAHIDWVLKVLGNGFNLPIIEFSQLEDCYKIYSNWLLNPDSRPIYFKKHRQLKVDEDIQNSTSQSIHELSIIPIENYEHFEQKFYQTIILHISQIYSLRLLSSPVEDTKLWNLMLGMDSNPSETYDTLNLNNEINYNDVIHHFLDLHRDITTLFVKVGAHLADVMSEETWDILLKTILGVTDHLVYIHSRLSALSQTLGNDKVENYRRIIMKITSVITDTQLRTFFEIWFRSQSQSIILWNTFQQRFNVWCVQSNVVQHWNAMTLSFTKKLSSIMVQNNTAKSQLVVFSTHGYSFKVNFSYEYLLFAWYKTVNLIQDPNTFPAQSYVHALRGISKLISVLEQSSVHHQQSKPIVDGNTLIRLFGRYLFNLNEEQLTLSEFSEARCMIYGTMCQLFSTQPVEEFSTHYQSHFYRSIIEGLSHFDTMQSILIHSGKLMNNQPTVAVRLLPHFVKSFQSIVPTLSPSCKLIFPLDVLRKSILDIITSTLCLPDLCKDYTLPDNLQAHRITSPILANNLNKFMTRNTNDHNSFASIKIYILNVLLHFLSSEANGDNLLLTLHLIDVYLIHENASKAPNLIRIAISSLSDQMLKFNLSEQVILGVFNLLNNLLERLPIDGVANQEILQEVVSSICKYIDRSLSMGDVGFTRRLIITAYFTLDRWVSQGIWITAEENISYASDVFKILHRGINYTPSIELLPSSPTHPRIAQSVQIQPSSSRHLPIPQKSQSIQHPGLPQGLDPFPNSVDKFNPLEVSKEINNIAELVLYRFLNLFNESTCTMSQLGSFLPCDPDFDDIKFSKLILERKDELSNKPDEKDISEYELDVPLCRHYLFEKKVLITIVEPLPSAFTMNDPEFSIKKSSPKQSPFIIVRSSFGKLCWGIKPWGDGGRVMTQKSSNDTPNPTPIKSTPFDVPNKIPSMPDISHHNTQSAKDLTPNQEGENHSIEDRKAMMDEALAEIIKSQIEQEKYVSSKNLSAHHDSRTYSTLPGLTEAYKAHLHFNLARKFLIQFGFINVDNQNKLIPLTITQKLIRDIEILDKTSTLTPITASVFYCTSSTRTFSDLIFPTNEINPIFKELLYSLGKPVNLSTHRGFSGQLNSQLCSVSPYFRDSSVELMFHCPALLRFPGASAPPSPNRDKKELNGKHSNHIHNNSNYSTDSFGMEANDYRLIMRNDQVFLIWMDTDSTGITPSHHIRSNSRSPSASPNPSSMMVQPSVVDLIGKAEATYIIVTPIKTLPNSDLFQVNVVLPYQTNNSMSHIVSSPSQNPFMDFPPAPNITPTGFPGPLIDGMVVRRDALSTLLRNTVISSHMEWLNCRSNNVDQQFANRSRILKQLNNTSSPVNNVKTFNSYCMKLVQTPLNTFKPDI